MDISWKLLCKDNRSVSRKKHVFFFEVVWLPVEFFFFLADQIVCSHLKKKIENPVCYFFFLIIIIINWVANSTRLKLLAQELGLKPQFDKFGQI